MMQNDQVNHISAKEARLRLQWVNHLLDSDPHSPDLWFKKAVYFHDAMVDTIPQRTRLERTLVWYRQCIREDPANWINYHNCSVALQELNRHEEALKFSREAVSRKPDNLYAQTMLVQTLVRLGLTSQAVDAFQDAAKHGCQLASDILGINVVGQQSSDQIHTKDLDSESVRELYKNPGVGRDKLLRGEVAFVFEASDPELYTLQFEVEELMNLGLCKAAEELCIAFELSHGANNLTKSLLIRIKTIGLSPNSNSQVQISTAYPLLEIVTQHLPLEYLAIVNQIFQEGGVGRFITARDVNDFDEQTRWLLKRVVRSSFDLNDPRSSIKPIPPDLLRVWSMAALDFIVAQKITDPLLIAYTATTLAEFYDRLGKSRLPFVLYKIAATNAKKVNQLNYFANAFGHCALTLMDERRFGPAVNYLNRVLEYEDGIAPNNLFGLYTSLVKCYENMGDFDQAKAYCTKAMEIKGLPEKLAEEAHCSLLGLDAIAKGEVADVSYPPAVCEGLKLQSHTIKIPRHPQMLFVTSKHEYYDSLLQAFDNILHVRKSLLERESGYAYFEDYAELMEALVHLALELELEGNALEHLEAQKSIILNSRMKYLWREKPVDLPDSLWEDLQRLVAVHRRMVDRTVESEIGLEELFGVTFPDVADALNAKSWECNLVSDVAARQIRQKLALGRFPEKIDCVDPEHTLILEFYPRVCFFISPNDPGNPEAVELPEATSQECERLAKDLIDIVHEWVDHFSQPPSSESAALLSRFEEFMQRLDEVFYRPIVQKINKRVIKNICIIPYRMLHILPLNLLGWSQQSRSSLSESFAVSFVPSLTCLESLANSSTPSLKRFLIVANTAPECPAAACRNPNHDCFSMDGAEQESLVLKSIVSSAGFDTVCLQDKHASLRTVSKELGSASVVHFATHGFFDALQPENSGMLLSLPEDSTENRTHSELYLLHNYSTSRSYAPSAVGEILTLDHIWKNIDMFRCQLVNLSACSTAMIDWSDRTDEFYGLANGFLYAGARSILSNLWPVHDSASAIFNLLYYEELIGNNRTPIAALKNTIGRLKESDVGGTVSLDHPLFWAGYRVIGFM